MVDSSRGFAPSSALGAASPITSMPTTTPSRAHPAPVASASCAEPSCSAAPATSQAPAAVNSTANNGPAGPLLKEPPVAAAMQLGLQSFD